MNETNYFRRGKLVLDPSDPLVALMFVPYNKFSMPIHEGGKKFKEKILKGAFRKSLRKNTIFCFYNHDPSRLLGVEDENLIVKESDDGLRARIKLQATPFNLSLLDMVAENQMQASVGMKVLKDVWPAKDQRHVIEANLREISLVDLAAYPAASSCFSKPAERGQSAPLVRFTKGGPLPYSLESRAKIIADTPGKENP
jgi:HK97 family phage prohead protease